MRFPRRRPRLGRKGRLLVVILACLVALWAALARVVNPAPSGPVYSVSQVITGLQRRPRQWVGRSVWVRATGTTAGRMVELHNVGPLLAQVNVLASFGNLRLHWMSWTEVGLHLLKIQNPMDPEFYRIHISQAQPSTDSSCPCIGELLQ